MDYSILKTQKKVKEYTREIIERIGICNNIKEEYETEYNYFIEFLFPRHYEYPEKFENIENIGIQYNPYFRNQKELIIIKTNGEIDNVSALNYCVTGKKGNDIISAMRDSITNQILYYRNSRKKLRCKLCESNEKIEVDHYEPQFIELSKNFLKDYKGELPTKFEDNKFNGCKFKVEDNNFELEWNKYHKDSARLRLLCKKCNNTRKKTTFKKSRTKKD